MLAACMALFKVLLTKAGELSPARAFCNSIVLARISSGDSPLLASSLCMAARICRYKKWIHDIFRLCHSAYQVTEQSHITLDVVKMFGIFCLKNKDLRARGEQCFGAGKSRSEMFELFNGQPNLLGTSKKLPRDGRGTTVENESADLHLDHISGD